MALTDERRPPSLSALTAAITAAGVAIHPGFAVGTATVHTLRIPFATEFVTNEEACKMVGMIVASKGHTAIALDTTMTEVNVATGRLTVELVYSVAA